WMRQPERLMSVDFHPGGRTLITSGYLPRTQSGIGVVQAWDVGRAEPAELRLVFLAGRVTRARFSPDGGRVLLTGRYAANVWDTALRRDVVSINHDHYLRCAAFSPDGARVAV